MPKLPNPSEFSRAIPQAASGIVSMRPSPVPGAIAEFGQTMGGVGAEILKVAQVEKKRLDDTIVTDAFNKLTNNVLDLQAEYSQVRGENAISDEFQKEYEGKYASVVAGLSPLMKNKEQQQALKEKSDILGLNFKASLVGHRVNQTDAYEKAVLENAAETANRIAGTRPGDIETIAIAKKTITAQANSYFDARGQSNEKQMFLRDEFAKIDTNNVMALVQANKFEDAEKYMDSNKDTFVGQTLVKFKEHIDTNKELYEVEKSTAEFVLGKDSSNAAATKFVAKKKSWTPEMKKSFMANAKAFNIAKKEQRTAIERQTEEELMALDEQGTLTEREIKSRQVNLSPTAYRTWVNYSNNKKSGGLIVDEKVEAELFTQIVEDPKSVTTEDITAKIGAGLDVATAKSMVALHRTHLGKDADPLKSEEAKTAIKRLNYSRTNRVFSDDNEENNKKWASATNLLKRYIINNPDGDYEMFADKLLEPVRVDFMDSVFDKFKIGAPGLEAAEAEREAELELEAGKKKEEYEDRKQIGNTIYIKKNGKWYAE